jgi:hypothetical protein
MEYGMWTRLKRMPREGGGAAQRSPQGGGESRQPKGPDHTAATISSYDNGVIMISKHWTSLNRIMAVLPFSFVYLLECYFSSAKRFSLSLILKVVLLPWSLMVFKLFHVRCSE